MGKTKVTYLASCLDPAFEWQLWDVIALDVIDLTYSHPRIAREPERRLLQGNSRFNRPDSSIVPQKAMSNQKSTPENPNVNAVEQLETLSEGKVADAVDRKSGTQRAPGDAPPHFDDNASALDR